MKPPPLHHRAQRYDSKHPPGRRGVSLMELLVVLAIVAVLAVLLTTVMRRASGSAATAKCAAGLRQLGVGIALYASEHSMSLPPGTEYTAPVNPDGTLGDLSVKGDPAFPAHYLDLGPRPWKLFSCPADLTTDRSDRYTSYAQNYMYLIPYVNGRPRVDNGNPSGRPIRIEEAQDIILYVDGVAPHEAESWDEPGPRPNTNRSGVAGALLSQFAHRTISKRHNGSVNALFGDGSVRFMTKAEACNPEYLDRK